MLNFHALSEGKRILDVNAEVSNGALDLGMSEQDLHGSLSARSIVPQWGRQVCYSGHLPSLDFRMFGSKSSNRLRRHWATA